MNAQPQRIAGEVGERDFVDLDDGDGGGGGVGGGGTPLAVLVGSIACIGAALLINWKVPAVRHYTVE